VSRFRVAAFVLFISLSPFLAFGQTASPPAAASSTSAATAVPLYPNTPQGLKKLMSAMMKLVEDGDTQTLATYSKSLVLPNPGDWFNAVFGKDLGPRYLAASERQRTGIAPTAVRAFRALLDDKKTTIETHKFVDSCDDNATATEYPLLLKREGLEPLYDVRFYDSSGKGTALAYFAYVDGGFRYIGALTSQVKPLPDPGSASGSVQTEVSPENLKREVTPARLIHQVPPRYPQEARQAHITGDVKIHAIIGADGVLRDLELVEGVCVLAKPAMDAVKDWRYKPMLIRGKPAEVDITLTVAFAL